MRHYPPRNPTTGNTSWGNSRDRATQARFRRMLLDRDGPQCRRCGATAVPLQAHHTTPDDGIMLCQACHRHIDPYAR